MIPKRGPLAMSASQPTWPTPSSQDGPDHPASARNCRVIHVTEQGHLHFDACLKLSPSILCLLEACSAHRTAHMPLSELPSPAPAAERFSRERPLHRPPGVGGNCLAKTCMVEPGNRECRRRSNVGHFSTAVRPSSQHGKCTDTKSRPLPRTNFSGPRSVGTSLRQATTYLNCP